MNQIMWAQLSADERVLLEDLALADDGMTLRWTDMTRRLIRVGLINKGSRGVDYTFKASITPAGRALIPAPAPTELERLQAENARLTAENEQLRTEASRRLDVIQQQMLNNDITPDIEPHCPMTELGRRLLYARSNRNMTQGEVATRAGIDQNLISDIESCGHVPNFSTMACIARALGMSLDNFVTPDMLERIPNSQTKQPR